jgi:hypothetical protein
MPRRLFIVTRDCNEENLKTGQCYEFVAGIKCLNSIHSLQAFESYSKAEIGSERDFTLFSVNQQYSSRDIKVLKFFEFVEKRILIAYKDIP